MKYLQAFAEKRLFDFQYVLTLANNRPLANRTMQNYLKKGFITRVKKNLYCVISLENKGVIASKFEIASNITTSSFISHHSALEYYGYVNQVHQEVQVSSLEQFHHFSFQGNNYRFLSTKSLAYVEQNQYISVTSLSRSVVDIIDQIHGYDDLEEVLNCLILIPRLNEKEIIDYLGIVNTKILYNKVGLVLSFFKQTLLLSDSFFAEIKKHIGTTKKYLIPVTHPQGIYYNEWYLYSNDIEKMMGDNHGI